MRVRSLVLGVGAIVLATAMVVQARQQRALEAWEAPAAAERGLRFERVRLSTGVELEVAERGPADGEPVLLLHGYTDSWYSYSRILEGLPPHVRAIVPSQRGHGDSERPECCYTLAALAQDARALLDALGIERADVVGHSMGSFVAQRLAIDHPDRVRRLVLIGSGSTVATPVAVEFMGAVRTLADPVDPAFVREFQESTVHRPVPPAFMDTVVQESGKLPAHVWRSAAIGMLAGDAKHELDRIRARTLILWGAHDAIFPRSEQVALLAGIPDAQVITYQESGHAPGWEEPERVQRDLAAFFGWTGSATRQ